MCMFAVLLVNKYLSSSELELILINIKRNNNYYYTIKISFIHIYDTPMPIYHKNDLFLNHYARV